MLRSLYHKRAAVAAAGMCMLVAVACRDGGGDDTAAKDSALARDLTLASAVATPAPELRDTPDTARRPLVAERADPPVAVARRAPVRRQPRPAPPPGPADRDPTPPPVLEAPEVTPEPEPAPAPASPASVIAAGTIIGLTTDSRACADANRPGDKMVAHTAQAVTAANGVTFPAGSTVVLEVASVVRSADADSATITFRVKSITVDGVTHPLSGEVIPTGTLEKRRVDTGGSDKKKVIGGAILGAIIGRVAGGDTRGAVIGAAAGAAVGTAAAGATSRYETCVPAGAALRLTVGEPLASEY